MVSKIRTHTLKNSNRSDFVAPVTVFWHRSFFFFLCWHCSLFGLLWFWTFIKEAPESGVRITYDPSYCTQSSLRHSVPDPDGEADVTWLGAGPEPPSDSHVALTNVKFPKLQVDGPKSCLKWPKRPWQLGADGIATHSAALKTEVTRRFVWGLVHFDLTGKGTIVIKWFDTCRNFSRLFLCYGKKNKKKDFLTVRFLMHSIRHAFDTSQLRDSQKGCIIKTGTGVNPTAGVKSKTYRLTFWVLTTQFGIGLH